MQRFLIEKSFFFSDFISSLSKIEELHNYDWVLLKIMSEPTDFVDI